MNEISPLLVKISRLIAHSHMTFQCTWRNLFSKCVSIVVYAHFFLSDKKFILLNCAHTFLLRIFRISAHRGVSMQRFFNAIFQNAHKNRWMET